MHTNHPTEDELIPWRVRSIALGVMTFLGVMACAYVAWPFLPALTWAVALAVMAYPLHVRLARLLPNSWAAGLTTATVVAVLVLPLVFVGGQLGQEAKKAGALFRNGEIEAAVERLPRGQDALEWVRENIDFVEMTRRLTDGLAGNAAAVASGSAWVAIQALVCAIVLFFALRDHCHLLAAVGDLSPFSPAEADHLVHRVSDAVHATVYATIVTGVVQGVTGGLLFWLLGIPGAILWGVVMIILGILPILGAFLVWVPAAIVLAVGDRWGAAVILVAWGVLMAGPVNNWLYARLAGDRSKLHPMPVLIAFVGGLAAFGISGMVLGPVILAVTLGLLDVWRWRFGSGPPRVIVSESSPL
jgi:predicted PurR-regulated permease PerM